MSKQGGELSSAERFRVLSIDGGPSPTIMIRVLKHIEEWTPGFLAQVDLFSGTSNGAIMSLALAHALNQRASSAEAICRAIDLERELLQLFKLNLKGFLRLSSLSLSMVDSQSVRNLFQKHFGNTRLGDLKKPMVSLTTFDASCWKRRSLHSFGGTAMDDLSLVDAALASSAMMPLMPIFRFNTSGIGEPASDKSEAEDLLMDGALTENSSMLSGLSDALKYLADQENPGYSLPGQPDYLLEAYRYLPRIRMFSLGGWTSHTQGTSSAQGTPKKPLLQSMFNMKWPPFGLQKDDDFFEYGVLWALAASVLAGPAMIDRQATDNDLLLRQLLGYRGFYRLGDTMPSLTYVRKMMLNPDQVLSHASDRADYFWQCLLRRYEGQPTVRLTAEKSEQQMGFCFLRWVQDCWMDVPASPVLPKAAVG